MTRKRSCVVREEADGAGPAMAPRHRPTSLKVKGGEETSWQRCKRGPADPSALTGERNAPDL